MASRSGFRLNRRGVGQILKEQCGPAISEVAEQVASHVRAAIDDDSIEVVVDTYTTDRGAAAVTIADNRGMEFQASDGALTRAAAAVGLEVKSR